MQGLYALLQESTHILLIENADFSETFNVV